MRQRARLPVETWLTKQQAAEQAQVSGRTIEPATADGRLEAARASDGYVRIRAEAVDEWLIGPKQAS